MPQSGSTPGPSRSARQPEDAAPHQSQSSVQGDEVAPSSQRTQQIFGSQKAKSGTSATVSKPGPNEAPVQSGFAASDGSSRRTGSPADRENLETQPTVIAKSPSLAQYPIAGLHPRDMGQLLEGEKLGHFELLEYVGGGGMGAVFRAHDTMLDRIVAVKVLSQEQSSDDETLRRFQNEAQSAARLDHENISRVHYVGEDRGWHYIVFEFIEGINLRDSVAQRGPLPLLDAVSYTLQISDALMHASRRDVVHRDIKPSNVLITPDGRAKLVDMGLARLHQVEPQGNDLTASGVTLGTFDYISPEQARDPRSADTRSDIYSLGCTLYFMLTARPPFPDGTVLQKLLQHQGDEPPDVRTFRPDLPDDFLAILNRMLAKAPDKRYQTPGELVGELTMFADRHGLEPAAPGSVVWLAPAPGALTFWERHVPWIVPLALLLLVVLAMSQIETSAGSRSQPPPLPTAQSPDSTTTASASQRNENRLPLPKMPTASRDSKQDRDVNAVRMPSENTMDRTAPPDRTNGTAVAPDNAGTAGGGSSIFRSATNGVMESISHWQRQMTDFVHSGLQSDRFSQWWSGNRMDPVTAEGRLPANESAGASAAPGIAVGDVASARAVPTAPLSNGVIVVGGGQSAAGEFSSLASACEAAKTGDVIELRFNGRIDERPIRLGNLNLTIRAADGYQPVVRFRPSTQVPSDAARSSIVVVGGNLSLLGLAIEFDVPRDLPADDWTVFELRQPEAVRLESCVLTVRNTTAGGEAMHPDVSIFRVRSWGVAAVPLGGNSGSRAVRTSTVALQLRNCFVRGAAMFLEAEPTLPLAVQWDNGVCATSQRMFSLNGVADSPPADAGVKIDLRHLTILARMGLVQMAATGDVPYLPAAEINASDSIILVDPNSPLVLQSADDDLEQLRRRFSWKGDRVFYEGVATFWRAANSESADDFRSAQWQTFWGARDQHPHFSANWQTVALPQADRKEAQRFTLADFRLRPGENSARRASSDGRDSGCQFDLLPPMTGETNRAELP